MTPRLRRFAPWSDAQDAYLQANWRDQTDEEIAEALSLIGPVRTSTGVCSRRQVHGLCRDKTATQRSIASTMRRIKESAAPWPRVADCPVEQDKNFLRALFADMDARGMTTRRAA